MAKRIKRLVDLWGPVVFWCGLIFFLSSQPVPPPSGNFFADVIFPYLAHLVEFGVLFVVIYRATKKAAWSVIFCLFYAISDEYHQSFVPTRTPSWLDVLVDGAGVVFSWVMIQKYLPKSPKTIKKLAKKLAID